MYNIHINVVKHNFLNLSVNIIYLMRWILVRLIFVSLTIILITVMPVLGAWRPSTQYQRPISGGYKLDIDRWYFTSGVYDHKGFCTIGYVALSPQGEHGYVSAGHCIEGTLNGHNWVWRFYQPNHYRRTTYYAGFPKYVYGSFNYIDTLFSKYDDVSARILTLNLVGYPVLAPVIGYYSWYSIHQDKDLNIMDIIKTGYASGVTSGSYLRSYESVITSSGTLYKFLILFDYESANGDSGGPVYTLIHKRIDASWEAYAKLIGIHIGLFNYGEYGIVRGAISADGIFIETGIRPMVI